MKTVDNFNLFRKYISDRPCDEDQFYFVQILVRGKDGHAGEDGINGNNKNRLIKFYTIRSVRDLDKHEYEMKGISELMNARVYIHPARRSFKSVANEMLVDIACKTRSEDYIGFKSSYSTACGKAKDEKIYIADIDDTEFSEENLKKYSDIILDCSEDRNPERILAAVPTVSGFHIVAKPFGTEKYSEAVGERIDDCVKKNNPTLLYFKEND